jgi:hypothetical protein
LCTASPGANSRTPKQLNMTRYEPVLLKFYEFGFGAFPLLFFLYSCTCN